MLRVTEEFDTRGKWRSMFLALEQLGVDVADDWRLGYTTGVYQPGGPKASCPFCAGSVKFHDRAHPPLARCNGCNITVVMNRRCDPSRRWRWGIDGGECSPIFDRTARVCRDCLPASKCWLCGAYGERTVSTLRLCPTCFDATQTVCCVCHGLTDVLEARRCPHCPLSVLCGSCSCPCMQPTGADEPWVFAAVRDVPPRVRLRPPSRVPEPAAEIRLWAPSRPAPRYQYYQGIGFAPSF